MLYNLHTLYKAIGCAIIFDKEREKFWAKGRQGYTHLLSDTLGFYSVAVAEEIASDSRKGAAEQHQIVLYPYVVSFMLDMPTNPELSGKGVLIFAQSALKARSSMLTRYGTEWAFAYELDDFMSDYKEYWMLAKSNFEIVDAWAVVSNFEIVDAWAVVDLK
ncbi:MULTISPECIES: hypothetical protein [Cysteiniphilum]|uniref:hypothetical protein n=1 Tax=Cysteiniphilum TaxID=2056696 RepID=UPI00177E6691|nr:MULTISPECIES: hypothetical protein [Cysteiniphilum]